MNYDFDVEDETDLFLLNAALRERCGPGRTADCPSTVDWILWHSGRAKWGSKQQQHIDSCPNCQQLRASLSAGSAAPPNRGRQFLAKLRSFNPHFVAALLLFAVLPALLIRGFSAIDTGYDFTSGLVHWATVVHTRIVAIGAGVGAVSALIWLLGIGRRNLPRPSISLLLGIASAVAGTFQSTDAVTRYARQQIIDREELFQNTRWVLWDSAFHWPDGQAAIELNHPARRPTPEQMQLELQTIKQAGFTGLYVYGDPQPEMLRAASVLGFQIIQGITVHDPRNLKNEATQDEIARAIAASDFVDAFVLGHLSAADVDMNELQEELAKLRQRSGKPVTTNFLLSDYLNARGITNSGRRLIELSDFMISDLPRPYSHEAPGGSPDEAAAAVAKSLDELRDAGVPALLSLVGYPSEGGEGFTEEDQRKFVEKVLAVNRGRGIGMAFTNAFDLPWKQALSKVSPYTKTCDGHLGFFRTELSEDESTATFTPKPALEEFRKSLK